jgi:hypothetical protein
MRREICLTHYAVAALTISSMSSLRSEGAVMEVTGAGYGEGLSLNPSSVVYAIYGGMVGGSVTTNSYTVQGVTFQTEDTDFSDFNGFPMVNSYTGQSTLSDVLLDSSGGDSISNSFTDRTNMDDQSLINIMNGGVFYNSSTPLSATIMKLTPYANYVVNFLFSSGGFPTRSESLLLNGTLDDTITTTQGSGTSDIIYSTTDVVQANNLGQITVQFNEIPETPVEYPMFDALIVSTPEPAPYCLMGGALWAILCRRCRRRRSRLKARPGGRTDMPVSSAPASGRSFCTIASL